MLEQMKAINDYIVVDVEKVGPKKVGGLLLTEELDETNRYICLLYTSDAADE